MPIVAVCPAHGAFPSQMFVGSGPMGGTLTLKGNVEHCPQCDRPSAVVDGTFRIDATGRAHAVDAPAWSLAALAQVQDAIRATARRPDVAEATAAALARAAELAAAGQLLLAVQQLQAANEPLAAAVTAAAGLGREKWTSPSVLVALLALLTQVLTGVIPQLSPHPTEAEVEEIVERAIDDAIDDTRTSSAEDDLRRLIEQAIEDAEASEAPPAPPAPGEPPPAPPAPSAP